MTSATLTQPANKLPGLKKWGLAAGLAVLAVIAAGWFGWTYFSSQHGLPAAASEAEFEEISGLRPKMIVVTANGGIVDFRFRVVNKARANNVMSDSALFPRLVVEETGRVLNPGAHHISSYEADTAYFLFYPNVGSSVKTGTVLSVMVGNTRFGPIVAK
ncbi:MAG: hypothetical protein FOGNACKC_00345 [Anaerolineae bacterium]|nr:hypothetical protein [Anaerolineae bacterium]